MKPVVLALVIVLSLGYTTSVAQNPLGMDSFSWHELLLLSQERQRLREEAYVRLQVDLETQRRADKLNALYKEIAGLFNLLKQEQTIQFTLQQKNIVDIKHDALVSKLTANLKKKVEELWDINRR